MIQIRKANERGHLDHGWLDTYHTFSFGDYYDPDHTRFRTLRVMNEDRVAAGQGFGMHPHRDMEIVTYVLSGELRHEDSMGNGEVIRAGELQRMTAGSGLLHSEFNPSSSEPTHLYQIWLLPREKGLTPSYEQRLFDPAGRRDRLQLVAGPDADEGALRVQQDARLYLADLTAGGAIEHPLLPNRHAWLQVLRGSAAVDGNNLSAGDGAAVSDVEQMRIISADGAEVMLFDLN
ncbi:Quercetin 2,3-dioxygenase [Posidoniimonas polymericola]|uniref:Quercetin 2,3-dioxygenase n=1 Tax=Posidoniimonas polymericola TaxID=2528002 RepID=A0A5C5YM83_9BACT|nr:pirin family protein [Posidoniimonas polymericola]TWT75940.1 Quercetin 2,3-dioxygenase [Posidoniimonas polymericola]